MGEKKTKKRNGIITNNLKKKRNNNAVLLYEHVKCGSFFSIETGIHLSGNQCCKESLGRGRLALLRVESATFGILAPL